MKCYAAFAKNEDIRKQGSSGGIFPLFSADFIKKGGIVYASVYDENWNVVFTRADNYSDLEKCFTSKYLQSRLNDTFAKISTDLSQGKSVLFCGTPCQASGLRQFIQCKKINSDNLLIFEIICHGAPGEDVFHKYMKKYTDPACIKLNMRNKDTGWNWGKYAWKMDFSDGSQATVPQAQVAYMNGFLANIYLRPSCYECKAKVKSDADVTLGDFWGIHNVNKDVPTKLGVSCVILRTEKGESAFSSISDETQCYQVEYKDILAGNPSLEQSTKKPLNRNRFFKRLASTPDEKTEELILSMSRRTRVTRYMNRIYYRLPKQSTSVKELNGKSQRTLYDKKESCSGCTACYGICPKDAIVMKKDSEGFFYSVIDKEKCIDCGLCKKVCPFAK